MILVIQHGGDNIKLNGIDDIDDSSLSSLGHMIVHEDPDLPEYSSESAYEADTIIDSPNSSSSTLQLNLSEDSNDQNDVNDNDINEEEVQILEGPPAAAAAPHIIVNYDEAGYHPRAPHGCRLLYEPRQGCACSCHRHKPKARLIDGKILELSSDSDDSDYSNMPALEGSDEDDGDMPPLVNDLELYLERLEEYQEKSEEESEEDG